MPEATGAVGALTDGTGVSQIDITKFVKDLIADFLITGAAALATAQIMDLGSAIQAPQAAALALGGALIHAGYRAVLRWATS